MAGVRAMVLAALAGVLVGVTPGAQAFPASDPPEGFGVADLVAQLDPSQPDRIRLQAVMLLGKVGGEQALEAVSGVLTKDGYPPVRSSAALVLGQTGDVRWVRALARGREDQEPVVQKAAVLAIKKLVQGFRKEKDRLARYTYHVDVMGLRERTGLDNNDLTLWFQQGVAERLAGVDGVTLGKVLDFDEEDPQAPAERTPDVELKVVGAVREWAFQRNQAEVRARIKGDMQIFLEPIHEALTQRKEARREQVLEGDVAEEDAVKATALPLALEIFDSLWPQVR
jgi:hypothetical protein